MACSLIWFYIAFLFIFKHDAVISMLSSQYFHLDAVILMLSSWISSSFLVPILTYASFTRSHRPILTPMGMRRLVERGLMTQQEKDAEEEEESDFGGDDGAEEM